MVVNFDANRQEFTLCSTWMRILHVPHAYPPARGGTEILCQQVSVELVRRGHEVEVVTSDFANAEDWFEPISSAVGATHELDEGVAVRRVHLERAWDRLAPSRRTGRMAHRFERELADRIWQSEPDVIMALPHLLPNVRATLRSAAESGTPLVLAPLLHEQDPNWPADELREALTRTAAVIALTEVERDRLVTGYDVDPEMVFVSGLGVDIPATHNPSRSTQPTVTYLGRLAPSKNIELVLRAMDGVWEVLPAARFVIAGATVGSHDPSPELTDHVLPKNRPNLTIYPNIDEDAKWLLLERSSCFVSASARESFGLTILEAMAARVPVVCLDTPVNREITGDAAALTNPTPESLAEAILTVLTNDGWSQRLRQTALTEVLPRYTWASTGDAFENAYEYAVGSSPRRSTIAAK